MIDTLKVENYKIEEDKNGNKTVTFLNQKTVYVNCI